MKREEAIEMLKRNKPTSDLRICGKELCTACDVAIEALEKQCEFANLNGYCMITACIKVGEQE